MPPTFIPPRVVPPAQPLGRLPFLRAFVRNPLDVLPRAVYEEDFVAFGGARLPRAWVTSPALVKAVLLDQRDKFRKLTQIRLLGPLLGKGILTSEGADWKWQRQASAPMFRPQELAGFVPAFVRAAEDTLARWRAKPGGSVHAIDADMTRATFDVVAATLLPTSDAGFADTVQRSVRSLQRFGAWGILYASLNLPQWFPYPGMLAHSRAIRALRSHVGALVRARKAERDPPDDLMRRLIAARDPETGRGMDDEQVVDNLLTFYLAGHETTAKALTWTLYLLARSPGWTAELEREIGEVTAGEPVGSHHVEALVKVQQVLKESMRLYPPVPMMSRQAVADAEIDGHAIRAGTSILLPIYAIQRHAKRWDRPDEFDPTRFSPANEAAIPRYQYMPFGAGPRVCIGMPFAMLEATVILATLLRSARFELARDEEPTPIASVTLMPKGGMPLRVSPR
ncbi:MAG: cytochrome P450 [Usitatibacter sp.]